jgi:hypothetical protein
MLYVCMAMRRCRLGSRRVRGVTAVLPLRTRGAPVRAPGARTSLAPGRREGDGDGRCA